MILFENKADIKTFEQVLERYMEANDVRETSDDVITEESVHCYYFDDRIMEIRLSDPKYIIPNDALPFVWIENKVAASASFRQLLPGYSIAASLQWGYLSYFSLVCS